jgi:hypothetical protein
VVDPEADLFRRLYPSEVPPVVNGIKGSTSLLVVASRSLPAEIFEASKIILKALGQGDARVLTESEAVAERLQGHDVLYLGTPAEDALPPLPIGLSLSPNRFTVENVTYDNPEDALFLVLPHPRDEGRVVALFLPFSEGAALSAARKVPHYGKYSYLVFRNGANQSKGTWPVSLSPLIHIVTLKEVSS